MAPELLNCTSPVKLCYPGLSTVLMLHVCSWARMSHSCRLSMQLRFDVTRITRVKLSVHCGACPVSRLHALVTHADDTHACMYHNVMSLCAVRCGCDCVRCLQTSQACVARLEAASVLSVSGKSYRMVGAPAATSATVQVKPLILVVLCKHT